MTISRTLAAIAVAVVSSMASTALAAPVQSGAPAPAGVQRLASADAHLEATITVADDVRYALVIDGTPLVLPSAVSLSLADGRVLGRDARIVRLERREISEEIPTPIGKRAKVKNACRELAVVLSDGATLRVRVFDDGFALRWETALPGRVRVRDEGFAITFLEEPKMFFLGGEGAHHGYEGLWRHEAISTLGWSTQTASLPLVVDPPQPVGLSIWRARVAPPFRLCEATAQGVGRLRCSASRPRRSLRPPTIPSTRRRLPRSGGGDQASSGSEVSPSPPARPSPRRARRRGGSPAPAVASPPQGC